MDELLKAFWNIFTHSQILWPLIGWLVTFSIINTHIVFRGEENDK